VAINIILTLEQQPQYFEIAINNHYFERQIQNLTKNQYKKNQDPETQNQLQSENEVNFWEHQNQCYAAGNRHENTIEIIQILDAEHQS